MEDNACSSQVFEDKQIFPSIQRKLFNKMIYKMQGELLWYWFLPHTKRAKFNVSCVSAVADSWSCGSWKHVKCSLFISIL